jgi:hypothetical protein
MDRRIELSVPLLLSPAKPRVASSGMAGNGNSAFSQYCKSKIAKLKTHHALV